MVAIVKVLFVAGTAAAAAAPNVEKRAYADVTNSLSVLNAKVVTLSSSIAAYTGGVLPATAVQNAEQAVETATTSATTAVQNTASVTTAQTTTIINYFKNTLGPNIKNTLTALVGKKSTFPASLLPTVRGDLSTLSSESNQLATALIAKAPAASKAAASSLSSSVISLFNSAIAAYA